MNEMGMSAQGHKRSVCGLRRQSIKPSERSVKHLPEGRTLPLEAMVAGINEFDLLGHLVAGQALPAMLLDIGLGGRLRE
jgi:hypothetical protein